MKSMYVSLSSTSIIDLKTAKKYIEYTSSAGFKLMMLDFGLFCSRYMLENFGKKEHELDEEQINTYFINFLEECKEKSIIFDTMRAPHLGWSTKRTDLNELMLQINKECIRCCEVTGSTNLIIQPLYAGISKHNVWQKNYNFFIELGRIAQERDICLLLENQCANINGHLVKGVCSDANVVVEWIDTLNQTVGSEVFGFCLDTECCNLCGQDMGEMIVVLEKRLRAVLIKECDGLYESSRLPYTSMNCYGGSTDWTSLIKGLRKIAFDGELIFDVHDTLRGFSPLLRRQIYPLIKSMADFFKWQVEMVKRINKYSSRVLFGAGKMCRNYMEAYGKEYPPHFICDNDSNLWGTFVCGLEVKSPEVLTQIPEECVVIICNTFYKEIAKQLRIMGIKNIETFNDEYL